MALVETAPPMLMSGELEALGFHDYGGKLDAGQAEGCGLVNAVFDDAALITEALKRARALANKAPTAVRATKALMKRDEEPVAKRMRAESVQFAGQLRSAELKEAVKAFTEKRAPKFD
jgi:enoyl-CoA hydratase/carnithine racemase